jgi:hypothetical protein
MKDGLARDACQPCREGATWNTRGRVFSPSALRASAEMEIFREVEQDENAIARIAAAQREELETEIADLQAEAERVAEEARELAGEVPF